MDEENDRPIPKSLCLLILVLVCHSLRSSVDTVILVLVCHSLRPSVDTVILVLVRSGLRSHRNNRRTARGGFVL
jgi:hypothetical protein